MIINLSLRNNQIIILIMMIIRFLFFNLKVLKRYIYILKLINIELI